MLPGIKYCKTVVENVVKAKAQKILLLFNLNDLHEQFKIEYPELPVDLSKFTDLKPRECILAGQSGTHNVCVLKMHENVARKMYGIKRELQKCKIAFNDKQDVRQKHFKKFVTGRDEHTSTESVKFNFFNKENVFHIISNEIPLPEDGTIGLKFFSKYDRYAITPTFFVLDRKKLLLQVDRDFIPAKTSKIFRIPATGDDPDILIIDQETIPDGIYKIEDGIVKYPYKITL